MTCIRYLLTMQRIRIVELSPKDFNEYKRELSMSDSCLHAFNAAQAYFIPIKNANNPKLARGIGLSWEDMIGRMQLRVKLGLEESSIEKEALLKIHQIRQKDPKSWRRKMPLPKNMT